MDVRINIIETAGALFLKEGIKKVKMDDIARCMGISKRTIYEYFTNKDELIRSCLDYDIEKQSEENEKILRESNNIVKTVIAFLAKGTEVLRAVNPLFFSDLRRLYPNIWREKIELYNVNSYNIIKIMLDKGIEEGFYRNDINVDIVACIIIEQLNILSDEEVFPPEKFSLTEVFRNMVLTFTRGLATPEGINLIDKHIGDEVVVEDKKKRQVSAK